MLRRSALFLALLLFCLCGGQLQTEPDAEQPLSSQPLFEGEAGLLEQSAAGNVPETIVRDFEDQKAGQYLSESPDRVCLLSGRVMEIVSSECWFFFS